MTITYDKVMAALGIFTAACVAGGWLLKIIKSLRKPGEDLDSRIKENKDRIDKQDDRIDKLDETLDYLVNANNLVIRTLFTVLGELSNNNDVNGNCKRAQNEIQKFLTPIENQHDVV